MFKGLISCLNAKGLESVIIIFVSLANKTTLDLADIILERWLMYKTKNKRPCSRVLNIQILHTQPEYGLYLTLCDIGIFRDYELDTPSPPKKVLEENN